MSNSRNHRHLGHRLTLFGWLVFLLIQAFPVLASDVPQLKTMYSISSQKADYIMVIDVSASMSTFWPAVSSGIADFTDALPDGDHISVILFEGDATNARILPRTINARARKDLRFELSHYPAPNGLKTDFGKALEKVAQEISRPESSQLQFVFFFSDYVHDPAASSLYQDSSGSGETWANLQKKFQLSTQGKFVQAFALMLPLSNMVGRDIGLVKTVLGDLESVMVNQRTLKEWFDRRRAEIDRDKIRALVASDLHRGWSLEYATNGKANTLQAQSKMASMPISITVLQLDSPGLGVRYAAENRTDLLPGKTASIPFLLVRPAPVSWPMRLLTTQRVRAEKVLLTASGRIQLQPSAELSTLAIESDRAFELSETIEAKVLVLGTPLWGQILILVIVAGACLFSWRTWLKPAVPVSRSFRKIHLDGGAFHEELTIPLSKARKVVVGNTSDTQVKSALDGVILALVIHSRKPVFPLLRPKRGLYLYAQAGDITYAGKSWDKTQRCWLDVDLPLRGSAREALPASYRITLSVNRVGERITITFSRN